MNHTLAENIYEILLQAGVEMVCICPGARNAPLVACLSKSKEIQCYYWYEERSAAFFALGKAKISHTPQAVLTTSGTAVGELMPAAMEAYYSGVPLILVTADRPRRFRGTGAPQTAEQVGIFGKYATCSLDLASDERADLAAWDLRSPAHLNVCFEEPLL